MTEIKIIHGDSIKVLKKFKDNFFDYCITSPPFKQEDLTVDYYTFFALKLEGKGVGICIRSMYSEIGNWTPLYFPLETLKIINSFNIDVGIYR